MTIIDAAVLREEAEWLAAHPEFEERPATLREFLGRDYLGIDSKVREAVKDVIADIMGETVSAEKPTRYEKAIFTGAIGIGKTTLASIVLTYVTHWCLCLLNPQEFFDLLPGSRIAFMEMSTSEGQAKEVVFGDIKARVQHSPWFKKYQPDKNFKNQIRFPKDVWIIPGDSTETTFEGYNILGGILDEADSHKLTKFKDYASIGYETIYNRMSSRFGDRGFVLIIGQMKSATGFAARKYNEFKDDPQAYAKRMTIWESRGEDYYRCKEKGPHDFNKTLAEGEVCGQVHTFFYDTNRKQIVPNGVADRITNTHLIEVPQLYRSQFETNPEKALKDLAGVPPIVGDPFISLTHKVHEARDAWIKRYGAESPVTTDGRIESWFRAKDTIKRVAHIDIGYASGGDAAGIAMGHVPEMVVIDGERKPFIVIDFLMRFTAPPGREIMLSDLRQVIYTLRDGRNFKLQMVTLDGFQSIDTVQQLQKRRFASEYLSMDRQIGPYQDLREAIYENRIAFPPYVVLGDIDGQRKEFEIAIKELTELVDTGTKIDHPDRGSKDVADAMAGVVFTLMGDRRYHHRSSAPSDSINNRSNDYDRPTGVGGISHPAFLGDSSKGRSPVPPAMWGDYRP